MDFEIKLNCENEKILERQFYKQRFKDLGEVPFRSGIFFLKFPNGKSYLGTAENLRFRLRQIFMDLFPKPQTIASRRRNGQNLYKEKWMEKAREDNPGLQNYKDLEIRCMVCSVPAQQKKRILGEMEQEERLLYYN